MLLILCNLLSIASVHPTVPRSNGMSDLGMAAQRVGVRTSVWTTRGFYADRSSTTNRRSSK
ncbi:hypothetical protein KIN20_000576, partial [Parelaphostrongylus tenuis]